MVIRDISVSVTQASENSAAATRIAVNVGDEIWLADEEGDLDQGGVFLPSATDLIVLEGFYAHPEDPPSLAVTEEGRLSAEFTIDAMDQQVVLYPVLDGEREEGRVVNNVKANRILLLGVLALVWIIFLPSFFAQQGGVAVIDINAVAKELGADQVVLVAMKLAESQINAELKKMQDVMKKKLAEALAEAGGGNASKAQLQQLSEYKQALQNQLVQHRDRAQADLARMKARHIQIFRERVRLVALMVAKSKGLNVVLEKSDRIFEFAEQVDITREVAAKLKNVESDKKRKEIKTPIT